MGGSAIVIDDEWDFALTNNGIRTLVLVGRTGNGKSATGNSILGKKDFKSKSSSSGVTGTCELQKTVLKDGQTVNVIDTPGLFEFSSRSEFLGREIVKCIDMAKDGIHAVLVVFSVKARFSKEEDAALRTLQTLFGSQIINYMIVVFTHGDTLEEDDQTLEDYLGEECPETLKEILELCENRVVLFDNRTKDEAKKAKQVERLFFLVDMVVERNGGKPYSDELFRELKEGAMRLRDEQVDLESRKGCTKSEMVELKEQIERSYEDQLKRITEMVECRLRETTSRLEQQLAEEQAARLKAEEKAEEAQKASNHEIGRLRENLEKAQKETEELRNSKRCNIL